MSLDLDQLLHPARAYLHPQQVLTDADLTTEEKRAILSSWASDACAVSSMPELRQIPGTSGMAVSFDDILDALKALDPPLPRPHRKAGASRWRRNRGTGSGAPAS